MTDQAPPPVTDREVTLELIEVTSLRAMAAQRELDGAPAAPGTEPLPHPLATSANLHHHLLDATQHQGNTPAGASLRDRAVRAAGQRVPTSPAQARFNEAIVHALHQLDHRTRLQELTIARLEAELAEARRALAALVADRDRDEDRPR